MATVSSGRPGASALAAFATRSHYASCASRCSRMSSTLPMAGSRAHFSSRGAQIGRPHAVDAAGAHKRRARAVVIDAETLAVEPRLRLDGMLRAGPALPVDDPPRP